MNRIKLILAFVVVGFGLHAPELVAQPTTSLPYEDDFESFAEGTPLVDGLHGWFADSADAVVQTNIVYAGTNAAMVPIDVVLSNRFENLPGSNVWLQMDVLPVLYDSEDTPQVPANLAAMLFVNSNGQYVVHNALAPVTNWVTITNDVTDNPATPVSNNWVRLDLYQNYTTKKWTLFADFILLKEDILFVKEDIASFSGFDLYNGSGATTFLDNVVASYSNPPALGADGGNWLPTLNVGPTNFLRTIPQGQNATAQTSLVSKTGGYYDFRYTNTVTYDEPEFGQWLSLGTSSGTNAGDIVINFNTSNLLARSTAYTATIQVDAQDTRFGFTVKESGQTISVAVKVLAGIELALSPAALAQVVDKGNNPTNQAFLVWNDSLPPKAFMDFSIEESIPWLSLSKYSGVSSGEQYSIGVMFEDMSGFDGGTNTGTITVRGWGDTGEGEGVTTQTEFLAVSVVISSPEPPTGVTASDGIDTEKVIVSWNAAQGAARYEVRRHTTFDSSYAQKIAEVTTTSYNDNSASSGLLYYYWIHSVSAFGIVGNASEPDSGYRGLAAPGGLFSSAGTYTNKVRTTWSASPGAASYELHRGIEGQSLTNVFHANGLSYDDTQVLPGVVYTYKVKAKNSRYKSAFSQSDAGYILSPPSSVTATAGTLVNKIDVSWSAANSATAYEVWRSEVNLNSRGSLVVSTVDTAITDTSVEAGKVYYYWVKTKNSTATSAFSSSGSGYAASGGVDLSVWGLVIQPNTIATGASPSVVSFRLGNEGTLPMEGSNSYVGIMFYASPSPLLGNDAMVIGQTSQALEIPAGEDTVVTVAGSTITMPSEVGDYYLFVYVAPTFPSTLVESNQLNNSAMREEPVHLDTQGAPPSRGINDYSGDGISDLVVVCNGAWYVRSVDGRPVAIDVQWGGAGFTPISGDFDGDGLADFAVYGAGMWFARDMAGNNVLWAETWGGSGFAPVYGVFSSPDAMTADLAVFDEQSGAWYVRTAGWEVILWDTYFGQAGFVPVSGDFDGDGVWDVAVYHESSGTWYGRTVAGSLLFWAENWGGAGFTPVVGDYDGDGASDMAMYCELYGMWFIKDVAGHVIVWGDVWGGPGYTPVYGDFDGDGRSDMAVYHESTGKWYIRSAAGSMILWESQWGGPGYLPVVP